VNTASFVLSIVAVVVSLLNGFRQWRLSRHANSLRVVVDLFKEHREDRLARARQFVFTELATRDLTKGLEGLPEEERLLVRDLAWFYENLGALVVYKIVDIAPIAGHLGGSAVAAWEKLKPIVDVEREKRRKESSDEPGRWQEYFEALYDLLQVSDMFTARSHSRPVWRRRTSKIA
jgi:hypothetical protein